MATRGVSMTIPFVAWDGGANAGKTGDSANFTMRWVKDGTAAALTTPTVTEIDSTNVPGLYRITISTTEADCNIGVLAGKSSTSGVSLIPVLIQFERLPDASPTAAGGVRDVWGWSGTQIPGVDTAGYPKVTIKSGTGTGEVNLSGGRADANVVYFGGVAGTFTGGRAEVNASHWGGTAVASANVRANLVQILGTATTEGAGGRLAGAFTTFFNVATPVLTTASVSQTGDSFARIGSNGAGLTALAQASTALTNATWTDARAGYLDNISDKTGFKLASDGVDLIAIETGVNLRQAMSPILAATAGSLSGAGTGTITIKGGNVATTRILATVDSNGNRSSVTLTLPS